MKALVNKLTDYRPSINQIPVASVIFFSTLSYISTYSGVFDLMQSTAGTMVAFWFACLFTLAIQLMLVYAVSTLKGTPELRQKIYWLTMYVVCTFFSVGFGYSFWFKHIRAHDYAEELHGRQVNGILKGLTEFAEQYNQLTNTLVDLAEYSRNTAKEEEANGRTCDKSPKGRGPRTRLRQHDARFFESFVSHSKRQYQHIQKELERVRAATTTFDAAGLDKVERALNQAVHKANAIRKNPQLAEFKAVLNRRLQNGRQGFVEGGVRFTCSDKVLEAKGRAIGKIDLPELQEVHLFKPNNSKASLHLAFTRLMYLSVLAINGLPDLFPKDVRVREMERRDILRQPKRADVAQESPTGGDFQGSDVLPLLFGLMVDLLIFLSARGRSDNERFKRLEKTLRSKRSGKSTLEEKVRVYVKSGGSNSVFDLYELLRRYTVRSVWGHPQVAVPYPARTQQHGELSRLIDFLSNDKILKAARLYRPRIPVKWLPASWMEAHESEMDGVRNVDLYKLDSKFPQEFLLEILRSWQQGDTANSRQQTQTESRWGPDHFAGGMEAGETDSVGKQSPLNGPERDRPRG